jgi:hypothetical protein
MFIFVGVAGGTNKGKWSIQKGRVGSGPWKF